jgi:DeoR/GlpR family transcriptional regulator of sugar metabolism
LLSRLGEYSREKKAIARVAIESLKNHKTLYLDGGTTCLESSRQLAARATATSLTIVTNSALACVELGRNPSNTIIGIGGEYDAHSLSFAGTSSEDFASRFHPDIAFLPTKGFVVGEGTFESSVALLRIKQILAKRCKNIVLLADHSKFGARLVQSSRHRANFRRRHRRQNAGQSY